MHLESGSALRVWTGAQLETQTQTNVWAWWMGSVWGVESPSLWAIAFKYF